MDRQRQGRVVRDFYARRERYRGDRRAKRRRFHEWRANHCAGWRGQQYFTTIDAEARTGVKMKTNKWLIVAAFLAVGLTANLWAQAPDTPEKKQPEALPAQNQDHAPL